MKENLSESEEMYLVTVARIQETSGSQPVPISLLAKELQVLPVSANQMVRKLAEDGFVQYKPYKGVLLTESGAKRALRILRHRRLWEVFLVERLAYTLSEAHSLACRLEHSLPVEAAERLAEFLGNPSANQSGEPIPDLAAGSSRPSALPLSQAPVGAALQIAMMPADPARRGFLLAQGMQPGGRIRVLGYSSSGDVLLGLPDGGYLHLAAELGKDIFITGCADPSGSVGPK